MMEERRRFPRLDLEVQVSWDKVYDEVEPTMLNNVGICKNISTGGVCIFAYNQDVAEGDKLSLNLALPSGEIISTIGAVVWESEAISPDDKNIKGLDMGIEFSKISNEDRETIRKFVAFAT